MSHNQFIVSVLSLLGSAVAVHGQSLNLDVGYSVNVTGMNHGAAANQYGVWNNLWQSGPGPFSMVGLNGNTTSVRLIREPGGGGVYFNHPNTSGDFHMLLDDGQTITDPTTYTFTNLALGIYDMYVYAIYPPQPSNLTSVTVAGSTQNVGGAMPVNEYVQGVTHALYTGVETTNGTLAITVDNVSGVGFINGVQLVYHPPPAGECVGWHAGPFLGTAQSNGLGDSLRCVHTWDPDGLGPQSPVLAIGGDLNTGYYTDGGVVLYDVVSNSARLIGRCYYGIPLTFTTFNNELIVGGDFRGVLTPGGSVAPSAYAVARWNGSMWQSIGTVQNIDDEVHALADINGWLMVGEKKSVYNFPESRLVRRWNPVDGLQEMSAGLMHPAASYDEVNAFGYYNFELFAAGSLPNDQHMMRWEGGVYGWQAVDASFYSEGVVRALQGFNGQLIAGGRYDTGQYAGPLLRVWDGRTWGAFPGGNPFGSYSWYVGSLAVYNGELIIAGSFRIDVGGGQQANNIARWDGSAWQALGAGITDTNLLYPDVLGLAVYNGHLYAVGNFDTAGGIPANNIARWDGASWTPILVGNSMNSVSAMSTFGTRFVVGGAFQQATLGNTTAINIAQFDGEATLTLGTGMNGAVTALKSFTYPVPLGDLELIAGGLFTNAGGVSANFIARWQEDPINAFPPPAWQSMGAGFNSGVYAIERLNNQTIAAGAFTNSGGTAVNRIARWNETTDVWQPIGAGVGGGMNSSVRALKIYADPFAGEVLLAGGDFTTAGGNAANRIARWTDGNPVWAAIGSGFNGSVSAIERHDGMTFAAGSFTASGATPLNRIAYFVPFQNAWFPVGNGIGFNGQVHALKSVGNLLYAAGQFTSVDGIAANRIAAWNGSAWTAVQGGADDWILALGLHNNDLHAGGLFTHVGSGALVSPGWGIYQLTGIPWVVYHPQSASIECDQNAGFTVTPAAGHDPLTYSWRRNGAPLNDGPTGNGSTILGAQTDALEIYSAREPDAGSYDCIVSNPCGSATSATATLEVSACCIGDVSGNQLVDIDDLVMVITSWGACPSPCPPYCAADANHDCVVNIDDLVSVITLWGACP